MKIIRRIAWIALLLAVFGLGALPPAIDVPTASAAAPPECPESWRAVRLNCKGGADGLVSGVYGGTSFFLTCNGESSTAVCASGTSWRYIMEGTTSDGLAVRCGLSGTSDGVNDFCGPLHLILN